jgi:hypothetical protein
MLCHQNLSNGKVLFEWEGCMVDIPDPFHLFLDMRSYFIQLLGLCPFHNWMEKGEESILVYKILYF